tara:strand:+ start:1491 stop:1760 length:270 start_codon:yes stop_codon:yes gene_type:complete
MKRKVLDSWKRPVEIEVPELPERYPQQLEIQLNKVRDATPEEAQEWWEQHLEPLGKAQLPFVAMMAVVQFMALATMMMSFYLIGLWANG